MPPCVLEYEVMQKSISELTPAARSRGLNTVFAVTFLMNAGFFLIIPLGEHYDNDGKEFLHELYRRLSDDPRIITVTPSEFLEMAPDPPRINNLWAGSWINSDYSTWIGEEEENRAWDLLRETRIYLQTYVTGRNRENATPEQLEEAFTLMYIAEGSDWFWWYGSDQNSGDDGSFDRQFRNTLKRVYETGASHR